MNKMFELISEPKFNSLGIKLNSKYLLDLQAKIIETYGIKYFFFII